MLKKAVTTILAVLALLALPGAASASTIYTPPSGATFSQADTVLFDWAWADDQYASKIIFSRSSDPNDPSWFGSSTQTRMYDYSNASIDLSRWTTLNNGERQIRSGFYPFPDGAWYWRLCTKTFYGEDDKCYLEPEIRSMTVTEVPAPSVNSVPPTLSRSDARYYAGTALRYEFGGSWRYGSGKRRSCGRRLSPTRVLCRVRWFAGDSSWRGWVKVWYTRAEEGEAWDAEVDWDYSMRIVRTNGYCRATGGRNCRRVIRR